MHLPSLQVPSTNTEPTPETATGPTRVVTPGTNTAPMEDANMAATPANSTEAMEATADTNMGPTPGTGTTPVLPINMEPPPDTITARGRVPEARRWPSSVRTEDR
jgi:hypothetical protein